MTRRRERFRGWPLTTPLFLQAGGVDFQAVAGAAGHTIAARNPRMPPAVAQGRRGSEDIEGGREGVGQGCAGGQRRGREHALRRPAGAGIEDVAVAAPLVPEGLKLRSRSAQGPVAQPQFASAAGRGAGGCEGPPSNSRR